MFGNLFHFAIEKTIEISNLVAYSMDFPLIYRLIHQLIEKTIRAAFSQNAAGLPPWAGGSPRACENAVTDCFFNQTMNSTANEGKIH